jgi:hypothetical protein
MDRRAFLTGLFGVAGAVALANVADAAPIARALALPDGAEPIEGLRTPDGTEVEQAQYWGPRRRYDRRRYRRYRRYRRRRSRLVCRNYWWRGRWRRRCRRVYYWR